MSETTEPTAGGDVVAGGASAGRTPRSSASMLGGAGVLVVGRYVVAALAWIGTVVVVRELSREAWGQYSFIFGLLGIVGLVADLKLSRIVLREVMDAGADAGRVVGSYVGLRLVIGLVSYLVALAWVLLGSYPSEVVQGTAIAGLNLVVLSAAWGFILLFEARLWLRDVAVSTALGQMAQFGAILALSFSGLASIVWFSWTAVLNAAVMLVWLMWASRRSDHVRLRFEARRWGMWLREAAPLALGSALDTVYFRIDIVMLSILDSYRAVGAYNVGYKFSDLIGAVPLAVVTPALTMMVAAWPHDLGRFRRTYRHALVLLTVGAVGAAVGFVVFAGPLVELLYTDRYADATDAARLLVVGQALHFFTLLFFSTLVAAGRNRLYPVAMLVGVVVNIALNLVLIPEYSYTGSGWATVVTEAMVLLVLAGGVARIPGLRPFPWSPVLKCLGAGVIMAAIGGVLIGAVPWPLAAVAASVSYLGLLHLTRVNGPGGLRALGGDPRDDDGQPVTPEGIALGEATAPSGDLSA